jgi:hypothetical protein
VIAVSGRGVAEAAVSRVPPGPPEPAAAP